MAIFAGGGLNHMPDRVALFLPSLSCGGAQRAMLKLAGAFSESGLIVDLVVAAAEGPYLSQVPPQVRLVDLGAGRVLASLPGLVRFEREPTLERSACDRLGLTFLPSCPRRGRRIRWGCRRLRKNHRLPTLRHPYDLQSRRYARWVGFTHLTGGPRIVPSTAL